MARSVRIITINPASAHAGRQIVGGTWSLTIGGETASSLAYNISAADLKTAIEALSSVGSGKIVDCQGGSGAFTVVFDASLGDVGSVTVTTTSLQVRLADNDLTIAETTPGTGDSGVQEVQILRMKVDEEAVDPYYGLEYNSYQTNIIGGTGDPGSELNGLQSIQDDGGVSVSNEGTDGEGYTVFRVTFNNTGGRAQISFYAASETATSASTDTEGSTTPGTQEVQTVTKPAGTTLVGGTWTVGESGQWGLVAAYNDTVGDIAGQIGTVSGSGNWTTGMVFEWADPGDQPNLTVHCNLIATGLAFGAAVSVDADSGGGAAAGAAASRAFGGL